MHAAEINDQVTIYKNPNVIITGEGEGLTALVLKPSMDFGCKMEIVIISFVPKKPTINRKKSIVDVGISAVAISIIKCQDDVGGLIDPRNIPIPLIEICATMRGR